MTDSYTDELFDVYNCKSLISPISRLICDVERFREEKNEVVTKQGIWICYNKIMMEINRFLYMDEKTA